MNTNTRSIIIGIIVGVVIGLAMFISAAAVARADEPLQWTYVRLQVVERKTLPETIKPYITKETEMEWASDDTIVGFFTQSQRDDLTGYVEVISVTDSGPQLHTVALPIIMH